MCWKNPSPLNKSEFSLSQALSVRPHITRRAIYFTPSTRITPSSESNQVTLKGSSTQTGASNSHSALTWIFPLCFSFFFLSLFFFGACSFPGPCETQPRGFRAEGCWSFLMWIAELISHYGVFFNKCARTWKRSGLIQIWLWGYVMLEAFRWEYRSRSCSHIWCRGSVEGEEINHLRFFFFFFIKMFILTRFNSF